MSRESYLARERDLFELRRQYWWGVAIGSTGIGLIAPGFWWGNDLLAAGFILFYWLRLPKEAR